MTAILAAEGVTVRFGGVTAVDQAGFAVAAGELLGLIGPNGAGKTTMLRVLAGVVRPNAGRIRLAGRDLAGLPTDARARRGLALTHQIVRPLRSMTALDNVALAAGHRRTAGVVRAMASVDRSTERRRAAELLDLVGIADHARAMPSTMPLGALKRLELARALALDPKVLLVDEPLAGLGTIEATRLADTLVTLNQGGLTIVLIEHNLAEVVRICGRLVVLDNGIVIAEGPPAAVMADPGVRAAYLGTEARDAVA
ncbi:MAG: ABC transporter ATP-binding protein [Alphaproteobacteria bacterium]